ncbi:unnamed protein product, partial [Prorocentrum cordatum]
MTKLRVLGWNPMWATGVRLAEIASCTRNMDFTLLAGTQNVCREASHVLQRRVGGRIALEAAAHPSLYTNASAGVSILLGIMFVVYTPVHKTWADAAWRRGPRYTQTVAKMIQWWRTCLSQLPTRCLPLFYADVNDGLGCRKIDGDWTDYETKAIGRMRTRERRRLGAGEAVGDLLTQQHLLAANAMNRYEATFFGKGPGGPSSLIDFVFLPQGWASHVVKCHTLHRVGAQLQDQPVMAKWDMAALMAAAKNGDQRVDFVNGVAQWLDDHVEERTTAHDQDAPDHTFELLERCMVEVGSEYFTKPADLPDEYAHWAKLRRDMLQKRIDMRASRATVDDTELEQLEYDLRDLSQRLTLLRRRHVRVVRESYVQASYDAWAQRNLCGAMGWARRAARCRFSAKRRDGRRFGGAPITHEEWLAVWSLPGGDGGVQVHPIDLGAWRATRDGLDMNQIYDMARYEDRPQQLGYKDIQ